jgi:hypothetical protein
MRTSAMLLLKLLFSDKYKHWWKQAQIFTVIRDLVPFNILKASTYIVCTENAVQNSNRRLF